MSLFQRKPQAGPVKTVNNQEYDPLSRVNRVTAGHEAERESQSVSNLIATRPDERIAVTRPGDRPLTDGYADGGRVWPPAMPTPAGRAALIETPDGIAGVLGTFTDPNTLVHAVEAVRDAGFARFDVITPYPMHGMDDAMGLKRSKLPWFTLVAGLTGTAAALFLQWFTMGYDYPLVIGGKPYFAGPAYVPITFEMTVLLAALTTVGAMFVFGGMPKFYDPLQNDPQADRLSNDLYAVTIGADDPRFAEAADFLTAHGATDVRPLIA